MRTDESSLIDERKRAKRTTISARLPSRICAPSGPLYGGHEKPSRYPINTTYSHCVRMTCAPICSAVVPGSSSYSDKPMATIGMLRFVDESLRKVRCNPGLMHQYKYLEAFRKKTHENPSREESAARNKDSSETQLPHERVRIIYLPSTYKATEGRTQKSINNTAYTGRISPRRV